MKNNQKKINKLFFVVFALILIFAIGVTIAAADTSVAWTKDIGDVTAADMSDDGSVIYAAVENSAASSTVYIYSVAGVEQTELSGISGVVQKLVCTADGTQAVLYTDADYVYHINGGIIDWSQSYGAAVTDIDISNAGSVLVVQGTQFHKYYANGQIEWESSTGTYEMGVLDPNNEYAIIANSGSNILSKYVISSSQDYWRTINNNSFDPTFSDYQNVLILYTNSTSAIILNNSTIGNELFDDLFWGYLSNPNTQNYIAISNQSLSSQGAYDYYSSYGVWTQATSAAQWSARSSACAWTFDNKMWIGGGQLLSGSLLSDVWYSEDGVTWVEATSAAQWSARSGACAWTFDNKMWIGGGSTGSNQHDVWYSEDGVTWVEATSAAQWSARFGACAWTFDNKMWIGGSYLSGWKKDIWYSSDGVTWIEYTNSGAWNARGYACAWVFNDKIWFGGGRNNAGTTYHLHDVWSSELYLGIKPSPTTPTYIFYNYTSSSPQHTQTTYNNAVPFTGTTELRTKPTLSIYDLQTTKTLTGNIQALSLSDRGDWLGTLTASRIYHDQITSAGFGTDYNAALGSSGTLYDIATANGASMSIVGQGQITDIYSQAASRVGTYTAGGAVTHVDIADKNALWAASGGEDGKVYVFSKDESSNWYLEYSSDSENPVTALKMSARGEFVLAGRTGSLTLYQTNTPQQTTTDFWLTLYVYKDSDSYRNAAVNVSVYTNNQWTSFAQGLTDSAGKYVVMVTAGQNYKFDIDNGQKLIIYQASPSVTSLTASIYSTPISSSLTYEAEWDPETNSITFDYHDSAGQTQSVTVRILRTDNWDVVYENTFTNQQSIEQNLPMIDDTVTYKVEMSAQRVSGLTRNTFFVSSSRDIVSIPLDQNLKNILFVCFLIFIAGLFSYYSAVRGPIVVAFMAVLFVYMGWLTIPWYWVTVAVVIAILAAFTQRR